MLLSRQMFAGTHIDIAQQAPQRAGDLTFRRFCTPRLSERRSADHDALVERARFHLRDVKTTRIATAHGEVQAYVFEPDPVPDRVPQNVLVAHGWTSESSFMAVLAEQLRKSGFRVVAFDQPGHGRSEAREASLIDCARALLEVCERLGPFSFAVAHSMGCLAALLVGEGAPPIRKPHTFERYVLIAPPNRFSDISREFGEGLSLTDAAQRAFERHLERIAHRTLTTFTAAHLIATIGRPTLLIHSRDDEEVLCQRSEEIAERCQNAELLTVEGAGHRKILYAGPVIRAAIAFLKRP